MRDYALFAVFFGMLPFIFKRPAIGLLAYALFSLMNPHRLTYGIAYDFSFAAIIAVATVLAVLLSKQPKRMPQTSITITLIIFFGWMTFTSFFAQETRLVWEGWEKVMKTFLMVFMTMLVLESEKDIKGLAWVMGISLGFFG